MDSNEILREIADELHNLNLNVMTLTEVLKAKQAPQPVQTDDEYEEAIRIHEEQLARQSAEITAKRIESDDKYLKQQAGLDRQLKHLGIM